ncbi:UbiA family prenyltransferase [Streptomyces syringium]|uniref:UbiA family prenyltransferase n=1 Tax=Streptomyces syringium TaxID=76729 RepID=UPI0033A5FCE5
MRLFDPTPVQTRPRLTRHLRHEANVTWRMLADNLLACLPPPLTFTLAACFRAQLPAHQILWHLGQILLLSLLYAYTFDTSNQARGAEEDRLNKPYRPIPAGLITSAGAMRRFWIAMPLYTLLGWQLGVVEWVLLWQAAIILINLVSTPRSYLLCKTPSMVMGTVAQLCGAWQAVSPIDTTVTQWITIITIVYALALLFEDIRDMEGDRAIGRRTPALVLGAWSIRIWFASLMLITPPLFHFSLYAPTSAAPWRIAVCDLALAATCWTSAIRGLLLRHTRADRVTYQLYMASYVVALLAGPVLWF